VLPPTRSRCRFVCFFSSSAAAAAAAAPPPPRALALRFRFRDPWSERRTSLFSCHGAAVVAGPEDRHWLFCFRSIREEEFDLVERSMRREKE